MVRGDVTDCKHIYTGTRAGVDDAGFLFFTDNKFAEDSRSLQSNCLLPQALLSLGGHTLRGGEGGPFLSQPPYSYWTEGLNSSLTVARYGGA